MAFKPAKKIKAKLRLCLIGGPGTGKTKSALKIAEALCPGKRIAVLDTEHESAAKYAKSHEFDHDSLIEHNPEKFVAKIHEAEAAGYDCLIIDSLSHAWMGTGGALEMVEKKASQMKTPNSYTAWASVTPVFRGLIETILRSPMHIICTVRSKIEHVQEKNEQTGKTTIRKIGMQPVMRDGIEYEFDLVGDLDQDHRLNITKSRCETLQGEVIDRPGADLAKKLLAWLDDGEEAPAAGLTPTPVYSNAARADRIEKGVLFATGKGLDELVVRNGWASIMNECEVSDIAQFGDENFDGAIRAFSTWIKNMIREHEDAQNQNTEAAV